MNKKILEQLKTKLEKEKKQIEKILESFAKKDPKLKGDYDTKFPDFGLAQSIDENALEVSAYENKLPVEYSLELKLQDINQALERIKQNKYGICLKCHKPINLRRLQVLPEAKTCIKCSKL